MSHRAKLGSGPGDHGDLDHIWPKSPDPHRFRSPHTQARTTAVSETHTVSRRILVVDDEPTVRRFASRVLVEAGYLVEEVGDGAAALDRVLADASPLHAVVSDIVMPRLNGVELLVALTATRPGLPVILMSGYGTEQLHGMGIAAPCAILPKPFSSDRLLEEVRRCLADIDPLALADADSGR